MRRLFLAGIVLAMSSALLGCGQMGPLYLPKGQQQAAPHEAKVQQNASTGQ